jgi:hypothetical protein
VCFALRDHSVRPQHVCLCSGFVGPVVPLRILADPAVPCACLFVRVCGSRVVRAACVFIAPLRRLYVFVLRVVAPLLSSCPPSCPPARLSPVCLHCLHFLCCLYAKTNDRPLYLINEGPSSSSSSSHAANRTLTSDHCVCPQMSASSASSSAAPSRGGVSGFDGSGDTRSFELKLVHLQNLHDREIQRLIDENRAQSKAIEQLTTGMAALREALAASNARADAMKGAPPRLFDTPYPPPLS